MELSRCTTQWLGTRGVVLDISEVQAPFRSICYPHVLVLVDLWCIANRAYTTLKKKKMTDLFAVSFKRQIIFNSTRNSKYITTFKISKLFVSSIYYSTWNGSLDVMMARIFNRLAHETLHVLGSLTTITLPYGCFGCPFLWLVSYV